MNAILMTKEVWMNSQFSIARFSKGIYINGTRYTIMGSKQDLVDDRFAKYYHKLGREKFKQVLEQYKQSDKEVVKQAMKDTLNAQEAAKKAKQNNKQQTKLEL